MTAFFYWRCLMEGIGWLSFIIFAGLAILAVMFMRTPCDHLFFDEEKMTWRKFRDVCSFCGEKL